MADKKLAAALAADIARTGKPRKGSPERRCEAVTRRGTRCRAPAMRIAKSSGRAVCHKHGGELGSLESQLKSLAGMVKWKGAQYQGLLRAYDRKVEELSRAREMGVSTAQPPRTSSADRRLVTSWGVATVGKQLAIPFSPPLQLVEIAQQSSLGLPVVQELCQPLGASPVPLTSAPVVPPLPLPPVKSEGE